jgi:protein SCO1/2
MTRAFASAFLLVSLMPLALAAALPAAALTPAALDNLSVEAKPGTQLPLDLTFTDETGVRRSLGASFGRLPTVLVFVDYTCRTLCGPIVSFAAAGLAASGLTPGSDFRLVLLGIDPRDGPDTARRLKESRIDPASPLYRATVTLSGDEATIGAITTAANYPFVYDATHDQYAHPAVVFVLTADGRITRVLSGLGLDGTDLRLALVVAGRGRTGSILDRIHLLCYGFDPVRGIYTSMIARTLDAAAATTFGILVAGIVVLVLRNRRSDRPA